ncbi:MAG: D-tyrosyl-tRNA(Tyr) deacylase [Deltaproteobacteria bacterium]|nr:D-tyrosyl-tRNA(Tyr) deacylase [Deltaproteobacteria bacterium]MBW2052826.1 D-tyrosyl-tRNA(Tyr) deacylase [Deltaproteobacteria bacterium]MBW2140520.1 D-tyrosyl-tRNA(Tyr) deacylase [Deltaproteobacteria bacterium]MBW2324302.1 D-tyrosyl-tRNA(Tyr) deacylase [Deltaproteobacteria bacterium]
MRAVIQRVSQGKVTVDSEEVGAVGPGLVILLGVGQADSTNDIEYLVSKIVNLRIFSDDAGKMNRSLLDVSGEALIVSQFTLWGDCRKGRRPSFIEAAPPELAEELYLKFVERVKELGIKTATGRFGAMMRLHLVNDGPVTLILDSRK